MSEAIYLDRTAASQIESSFLLLLASLLSTDVKHLHPELKTIVRRAVLDICLICEQLHPRYHSQVILEINDRTTALEPALRVTKLTRRQIEVLRLLAQGSTSKHIAEKLGITVRTVVFHKATLMRALHVRNVTELMHVVTRKGLLYEQPPSGDR